jgi:predicted TIM-barrel enzyme
MPDGDQGLAQSIYLANLFAQKGTCQCEACQLLRQSTEAMINQVLKKPGSAQSQVDPALVAQVIKQLGNTTLET